MRREFGFDFEGRYRLSPSASRRAEPTGRLRHPGATLTVAEPEALAADLAR